MSLLRTGLRVAIRTAAPPLLGLYILYKYWQKIEHTPTVQKTIKAYRGLYKKLKAIVYQKAKEQRHDEPEWSYQE